MHMTAIRNTFAVALLGLTFAVLNSRGLGQPPLPSIPETLALPAIPVAPTVPAPVAPPGQHIRFQNLLPNPAKLAGQEKGKEKAGDAENNGDKDKKDESPDPLKVVETGPELTLGQCVAIAIERQPTLKAVKASMASTEVAYRSLLRLGTVGTILSPDLEVRKQQAKRGLAAAASEYQKAHNEVVQDVTRLYYTAVYARQQEAIADGIIPALKEYIRIAIEILENTPNPKDLEGLNGAKVEAMKYGLRRVQQKQAEARIGRKQAMAALRQVMAVEDRSFPFRVKDAELPVMEQKIPFTKDFVVDLAVGRRPELALAAAGVDAFRLEVYAQGKIPFKRIVPTFASGVDLHAKEIPQASRGKDYRPGGIIPELPAQLVGTKFDRVCRAMAFSQKADAVFEGVRGLVILEAENTYFDLELSGERLRLAKEKLDLGMSIQKFARLNAANTKAKDVLVQAEILAAEAQSDYVEAVYQHLLSLAALERVTAGGIQPAFTER